MEAILVVQEGLQQLQYRIPIPFALVLLLLRYHGSFDQILELILIRFLLDLTTNDPDHLVVDLMRRQPQLRSQVEVLTLVEKLRHLALLLLLHIESIITHRVHNLR